MHTIDFGRAFIIYLMPAVVTGIILLLTGIMLVINTAGYISTFM